MKTCSGSAGDQQTHTFAYQLRLVGQVADRVMAINDGKLLAIGKPDEVRENREVQEAYLGVST